MILEVYAGTSKAGRTVIEKLEEGMSAFTSTLSDANSSAYSSQKGS